MWSTTTSWPDMERMPSALKPSPARSTAQDPPDGSQGVSHQLPAGVGATLPNVIERLTRNWLPIRYVPGTMRAVPLVVSSMHLWMATSAASSPLRSATIDGLTDGQMATRSGGSEDPETLWLVVAPNQATPSWTIRQSVVPDAPVPTSVKRKVSWSPGGTSFDSATLVCVVNGSLSSTAPSRYWSAVRQVVVPVFCIFTYASND
jgi:hypothetical protein